TLAPHITNLPDRHTVAKTLLDVQIVVIEICGVEILVDPVNVKNRSSAAWIDSNVAARTQLHRIENVLARLPRVRCLAERVLRVNGYGFWPRGIVLHTVGVIR